MRATVLTAALALSACVAEGGSAGKDSAPPSVPGVLWNTSWVAETIAGKPVAPPGSVTLRFDTGSAAGSSGCNSYGGDVTLDGAKISFGPLISTKMACLEDGRMSQEFAFMQVLTDALRYERTAPNRLEIVTADGRRAVFSTKP